MPFGTLNLHDANWKRYQTYRAVQVTSILLGLVVIYYWPDLREESFTAALQDAVTGLRFQPLLHILTEYVTALNTPAFWCALTLYVITFIISVTAYARIMAYSPVMVGQLLLLTVTLCLFGAIVSFNWITALTLLAPLLFIMTVSGILYNLILGGLRVLLLRNGYYQRHTPKPAPLG